MALSRWISNLEAEETMAKAVAAAKVKLTDAKTPEERRAAEAELAKARFKQADVARTMRAIELETKGRFTIGEPMPTEWRTAEEIAAQGIIGVYREGAGDGA